MKLSHMRNNIGIRYAESMIRHEEWNKNMLPWLYVLPEMQRRGIGRRMIQHALEIEPGLYYVEVLYGNEPARKLYESFGFAVKEILTGHMPGNEEFEVRVYSMYR